jgi:putative phosphoesterase
MKIGIISDIHSNIYALESVIKIFKDIKLIFCAGDLTGYYSFVNEVIERIRSDERIICIQGNHDHYLLTNPPEKLPLLLRKSVDYTKNKVSKNSLEFLSNLDVVLNTNIMGSKVLMTHGSPWDHLSGYVYPGYRHFEKFNRVNADIIILGHTHYPMIKKIKNKIIINPGSCGQPRDGNRDASCAILETKTLQVSIFRIKYDIERFIKRIKKEKIDKKFLEIFKKKKECFT